MRVMNLKPFPFIAFMLLVCAIITAGITAYAADDVTVTTEPPAAADSLNVKEVWLTGDTLHIKVLDGAGEGQTLELNLCEYAKPADEYVTVQATDSAGRASNAVTFKNPYYEAPAPQAESGAEPSAATSESAVSIGGAKPFTPDGAGSVADNATDKDGKEFFTVETPDGNTFYLIVDRQRNSENVYLLNAVTEEDLAFLAKPGNGMTSESVIPAAPVNPTAAPAATAEPVASAEPAPASAEKSGDGNMTMYVFIGLGAIAAIGAGYYFKVVRPKKNGAAADYDETEDFDDDEEHDIPDDDEDEEDGEDGDGE